MESNALFCILWSEKSCTSPAKTSQNTGIARARVSSSPELNPARDAPERHTRDEPRLPEMRRQTDAELAETLRMGGDAMDADTLTSLSNY